MSRWSVETVEIRLSRAEVVCARILPFGRTIARELVAGGGSAEAAIAATGARLRSLGWSGRWRVIVGDELVRYATLLPVAGLRAVERDALALERIETVFGAIDGGWEVRLDGGGRRGAETLIAALPRRIPDALRAEARTCRAAIASIRPALAEAIERSPAKPGNGSGWFVRFEPGRLVLARFERGAWSAVRSQRASSEDELCSRLEAESLAGGLEPARETVLLERPAAALERRLREGGWTVLAPAA